ncbi:G-protein coupled receptor GRL101 [Stylophora pistillata]|uniref:G-protein coupled receptor GRL101 n=1 Tax=Stylophora pistillata TaxID=50429 RepID=A0A2B4SJQ7_STYPI|nr:G-protein coupled receptor GRL101 [Stylophora pistillata]
MASTDGPLTISIPTTRPPQSATAITVNIATGIPATATATEHTDTPTPTATTSPAVAPTCVDYKQWLITVPKGHYVEMTIKNMNLRPWACLFETYVMVKDGHSLSSNVLRILCEAITTNHRIASSGNKMIVERYGKLGFSESAGFKANFQAKPLKSGDPPKFRVPKENVALLEEYYPPQRLLCQAGGSPAPIITWYKNGKVLEQNITSVLYKPEWDSQSGNYTCIASNFNGSDTKTLLVHTEKCSSISFSCTKLKSHPFWFRVDCWNFYKGTVPRDIPLATKYLSITRNLKLVKLTRNAFGGLKQLEYLEINNHNSLDIEEGTFNDLTSLEFLDLSSNQLSYLDEKSFRGTRNFTKLMYLRGNQINRIAESTFEKFFSLEELHLSSNELGNLPPNLFQDLSELRVLDISYNKISVLSKSIFDGLQSLEKLILSHNEIEEIPAYIFSKLKSLKTLYLENNRIEKIHPLAFHGLRNLEKLKLDSFSLCCYASLHLEEVNCEYPKLEGNALSSCNRMIDAVGPRRSIWLLGILAVLGNLALVAWRLIRRDDHPVQTCLLTNLAVADFLMGVYLMMIAIKDEIWAGIPVLSEYAESLESWKERCLQKISVIGVDPASIPAEKFSPKCLPPVEASDLLSYLVLETSFYTKKQFKAFKSLEAFNQMVSGFVTSVVGKVIAGKYAVRARVWHSQHMNDPLVNIWVISENDGTILSAHCLGCKAGLAESCSHIASVLFMLEATTRIHGKVAGCHENSDTENSGPSKCSPSFRSAP